MRRSAGRFRTDKLKHLPTRVAVVAGRGGAKDGPHVRVGGHAGDDRDLLREIPIPGGEEGERSAGGDPDQADPPLRVSGRSEISRATSSVSCTVSGRISPRLSPDRSGTTTRYPARANPSASRRTFGNSLPSVTTSLTKKSAGRGPSPPRRGDERRVPRNEGVSETRLAGHDLDYRRQDRRLQDRRERDHGAGLGVDPGPLRRQQGRGQGERQQREAP
jgi:hypothetical protein